MRFFRRELHLDILLISESLTLHISFLKIVLIEVWKDTVFHATQKEPVIRFL